jgi:hypothetical protein
VSAERTLVHDQDGHHRPSGVDDATVEVVEEFDDGYYRSVGDVEQRLRDELVGGRRHIFEAEMTDRLRRETSGSPVGRGVP